MKKFDVFIVGGGAAGMSLAVYLKMNSKNLKVAVAEQLSRVGKKLITTGNGRCNITNSDERIDRYHSSNIEFFSQILNKYDNKKIEDFFEKTGVKIIYDEEGRAYPESLQASSVVDALRFSAAENSVEIFTDLKVLDYKKSGSEFIISTSLGEFFSKALVIAAGLYSGGKKSGSDGSIFELLKSKGYGAVKVKPAIVQIKTDNQVTRSLKGIKVLADVSLKSGKTVIRKEFGEVLFCDYGLSGPPVMQISGECEKGMTVSLDLMPKCDENKLFKILKKRKEYLKNRISSEFFTGLLNKRVGQSILKSANIKSDMLCGEISDNKLLTLSKLIKDMSFSVTGDTGFENSQVTKGGLSTGLFDKFTLMSKKEDNLYAVGEILDICGDCGGFNLHWAWSSAMCCADSIIKAFGGAK